MNVKVSALSIEMENGNSSSFDLDCKANHGKIELEENRLCPDVLANESKFLWPTSGKDHSHTILKQMNLDIVETGDVSEIEVKETQCPKPMSHAKYSTCSEYDQTSSLSPRPKKKKTHLFQHLVPNVAEHSSVSSNVPNLSWVSQEERSLSLEDEIVQKECILQEWIGELDEIDSRIHVILRKLKHAEMLLKELKQEDMESPGASGVNIKSRVLDISSNERLDGKEMSHRKSRSMDNRKLFEDKPSDSIGTSNNRKILHAKRKLFRTKAESLKQMGNLTAVMVCNSGNEDAELGTEDCPMQHKPLTSTGIESLKEGAMITAEKKFRSDPKESGTYDDQKMSENLFENFEETSHLKTLIKFLHIELGQLYDERKKCERSTHHIQKTVAILKFGLSMKDVWIEADNDSKDEDGADF